MTRLGLLNAGGLALALAPALALGLGGALRPKAAERTASPAPAEAAPGGAPADAGGQRVPPRGYARIVSTSALADRLLLELCEPDRVLAFSAWGLEAPWGYRLAGRRTVGGRDGAEALVALRPDLVLLTTFGAAGRAAQLRAAGITVFELGEVRGLATLGPTATALGALCGRPAEGRELVARLRARLARIALPLGDRPRRRALYAAPIGTQIYGGTRGTSYHDVLTSAGLVDVAAERFEGWPKYRAEDLLALAPPLVVTKPGGRAALCAHPGLAALPACARAEGILELPAALLDDPGLGMLDAAERLFEAAYPDVATPSAGPPAAR